MTLWGLRARLAALIRPAHVTHAEIRALVARCEELERQRDQLHQEIARLSRTARTFIEAHRRAWAMLQRIASTKEHDGWKAELDRMVRRRE
jgi:uncharacterized coiled-coil DUF342 family protein